MSGGYPPEDSKGGCALGCFWGVIVAVILWVSVAILAAVWHGVRFDG